METPIRLLAGIISAAVVCGTADARPISADSGDFFVSAPGGPPSIPYFKSDAGSLLIAESDGSTYQLNFVPGTGRANAAGAWNADPMSAGECDNPTSTTTYYLSATGGYPSSPAPNICWAYMMSWGADPGQPAPGVVDSQVMVYQFQDGQSNANGGVGVFPGTAASTPSLDAIEVDFNYSASNCKYVIAAFTVVGTARGANGQVTSTNTVTYAALDPCATSATGNAFFFNNTNGNELVLVGKVPKGWYVISSSVTG
jgi:hypothetical protein